MTLARYLAGLAMLGLIVVPLGAASHAWLKVLRPDWSGALARLAEIVVGLSATVVVLELLGAASLFDTAAVVIALTSLGVLGWWMAQRMSRRDQQRVPIAGVLATETPGEEPGSATASVAMKRIAVVVVALVVADWATRTVDAYHRGMTGFDTLWYHLPLAARFVQDGSTTPLHFFDLETVTAYYPATSELFHGLGILLFGTDVLSPAINLGWLSVALLAAWCVGRPFGVPVITLAAVACIMATPNMVATQPGGGYDDIVVIALLLTAAAVLINTHAGSVQLRSNGIGIAAVAAGLAASSKFTSLVPVIALTFGVVIVARRGRRALEGGIFAAGLVLTGAYWYTRNWVVVGNPLPSLHIRLGPISLPNPVITTPSSTVAHFLTNWNDWTKYFFPGFRLAFGPVWWVVFTLSAAGLVVGTFRARGSMARMLAVIGIVTGVGFVVSPQYLTILGAPVFFVDNIRYADPAIVLGLVLLPLLRDLAGQRWRWSLLLAFTGVTIVSQLDETLWPSHLLGKGFVMPITGVDAMLGALIGVAVLVGGLVLVGPAPGLPTAPKVRRPLLVAGGVLVVVAVGAGFGLERFYLDHRYESSDLVPPFGWAEHISGARIGVAGTFSQLQYALYGRDLSNYVQYIGVPGADQSYAPATTCRQWREQVNRGHYDYVMTSTGFVTGSEQAAHRPMSFTVWTSHDPNSKLVRHIVWHAAPNAQAYVGLSVFKIRGDLSLSACASPVFTHVYPTPP